MLIDGSGGATIDNCLFTNNYNVHNGAHLKIGNGAISYINNCSFINNSPELAPIFNDNYSAARFTNCFINANAAQEVFISTGFPSLINCTVTNYRSRAYSCYAAGMLLF